VPRIRSDLNWWSARPNHPDTLILPTPRKRSRVRAWWRAGGRLDGRPQTLSVDLVRASTALIAPSVSFLSRGSIQAWNGQAAQRVWGFQVRTPN
jgi:hypothetical protein